MEKVKVILFVYCVFFNCINVIAQNSIYIGEYLLTKESQQSTHSYCEMELKENGRFMFLETRDLYKVELEGNWYVEKDSILILESVKRTMPPIVTEYKKKSKPKKCKFRFYDLYHKRIFCNLFVISKGDTIQYQQLWQPLVVDNFIDSFYFIGATGNCSKTYVHNPMVYRYDIVYDDKPSFINEEMIIKDGYIKTSNIFGKQRNLILERKGCCR